MQKCDAGEKKEKQILNILRTALAGGGSADVTIRLDADGAVMICAHEYYCRLDARRDAVITKEELDAAEYGLKAVRPLADNVLRRVIRGWTSSPSRAASSGRRSGILPAAPAASAARRRTGVHGRKCKKREEATHDA